MEPIISNRIQLKRASWVMVLIATICTCAGCVSDSYQYGLDSGLGHSPSPIIESSIPVRYGGEHPNVDRIEKIVQSPRRLIHKITGQPDPNPAELERQRTESVEMAREFLAANGIDDVAIEVRAYDPASQWRRLQANEDVRPIWKYTGGTLNWLRYTLLPLRAFRSDQYDPYTNTLNLNSTRQPSALFESAMAKEYRNHQGLGIGTYAILQYAPLVPLIHKSKAASDLLTYGKHHLDGELDDQLYPATYSRIGSAAASEAFSAISLVPDINPPLFSGPLAGILGSSAGHSTGTLWAQTDNDRASDGESAPQPTATAFATFSDMPDQN